MKEIKTKIKHIFFSFVYGIIIGFVAYKLGAPSWFYVPLAIIVADIEIIYWKVRHLTP